MRHLMPLFAAVGTVLFTAPAHADFGDQLFKLLPDDGAASDFFASSVAISGATAIVGATGDDDNGTDSGSAYLFDMSDPTKPVQVAKLVAEDGAADDWFGAAVGISGAFGKETVIIGAPFEGDNGTNPGAAYLFDVATGQQLFKLSPDDGEDGDLFGWSVAISGTTAIIGARRDIDDDNGTHAGSAYLFDTSTGQQLFKLLPDDGAESDLFGFSVAISCTPENEIAIIGAWGNDDNGEDSGSAYLFDTTTGQQIFKLLPGDGAAGDRFGRSVAISSSTAIVGAYWDDSPAANAGSAYVFDISDPKNPVQLPKLMADDAAPTDQLGVSVAISGAPGKETAVVGADGDDGDSGSNAGSVYLFDITTGQELVKLLPDDGAASDNFGRTIAISGAPGNEVAIVGALADDDNGVNSGSAYLFDATSTPPCPWDIDDSGMVDVSDLLLLLASWGPCKRCPADFDDDGFVGLSDLLALLANWGPCV